MKNKVAIVTGSAQGIGRATAHAFADQGAICSEGAGFTTGVALSVDGGAAAC